MRNSIRRAVRLCEFLLLPFSVWLCVRSRKLAGRLLRAPRFAKQKNAGQKFTKPNGAPYKRRAFTLLELLICLMIIGIAGGVLTWQVKGMLDKHRLSKNGERLLTKMRELQTLALSYQTDMELELSCDGRRIIYRIFSDEPLPFLRRGEQFLLDGSGGFVFNDKRNQPVRFVFYSSGWVEPRGVLELEGKKERLWIDLTRPLQIKLSSQKPSAAKDIFPARPD